MRYFTLIALLGLGITACTDNSPSDTATSSEPAATVTKHDAVSKRGVTNQMPIIAPIAVKSNDTLIIEKRVAIFIRPNESRIEKEKKKGDEEGFDIATNDYLYCMSTAQEFIDSVKVPIIEVSDEKFIRFVGSNKKSQLIEVSKLPELWSIYLFEPGKKAKQVDMTMIEEAHKDYFK